MFIASQCTSSCMNNCSLKCFYSPFDQIICFSLGFSYHCCMGNIPQSKPVSFYKCPWLWLSLNAAISRCFLVLLAWAQLEIGLVLFFKQCYDKFVCSSCTWNVYSSTFCVGNIRTSLCFKLRECKELSWDSMMDACDLDSLLSLKVPLFWKKEAFLVADCNRWGCWLAHTLPSKEKWR